MAVVDTQKVIDAYAQGDRQLLEIQQWAVQQQALLQELQDKFAYLSEENFKEALDIMRMPRPLPAKWAKRERELRDINDQKESRFLELQSKVDRTPQEGEEFSQLQEIAAARQRQLEEIAEQLNQEFRARTEQAQAAVRAAILDTVKAVASEKGYALVLAKTFVLFGGDDITDSVIMKLTGARPPLTPAATTTPAAPTAPESGAAGPNGSAAPAPGGG